jgi:transposase
MSKSKQLVDTFGRMEVIAKAVRRRWPEDVRAAIVAEAQEEGAVVSAIARRHGVAPRQVFAWRKAAREQALALGAPTPLFAPVVFEDRKVPSPSACAEPLLPIEIETCGAKLRIPPNTNREAILAVMEGLAAFTRRR